MSITRISPRSSREKANPNSAPMKTKHDEEFYSSFLKDRDRRLDGRSKKKFADLMRNADEEFSQEMKSGNQNEYKRCNNNLRENDYLGGGDPYHNNVNSQNANDNEMNADSSNLSNKGGSRVQSVSEQELRE